jgi:hypothetical protein
LGGKYEKGRGKELNVKEKEKDNRFRGKLKLKG